MRKAVEYHHLDLSYAQFDGMAGNISYTSIGKYYVYQKLGEGGFGQVYKGMNDETKLPVAIKVINIFQIKQQKNQALKEIKLKLSKNQDKIMQMCDSPYLVKCLDVYQNDDLKIIIMEFCNGGTLESYILEKKKIPEKEAILILKQILNGIAELHSHNIIHRDLKAENILMHNNFFKIADFGFSKKLQISNQVEISKHTFLGTLTTMAPQVMARQHYGLKADIWSVGIIFFQMLFGHYPFNKTNKPQLLQEIRGSDLMNKETLIFEGTKVSKQAYDFLKLILVVDQKMRIGWRQLIRHPILNENKGQSKISRFLYDNQPVIMPKNGDDQENPQTPQFLSKVRKQTETAKVIKILSQKGKEKKNQMRESQQDQAFKWMNVNIYECLKSELIFQEIIDKIQKHHLLDLEKRQVIELMYLLSTRCFLDLSPIQEHLKQLRKKFTSYGQIYEAVEKLYSRLKKRWEYYQKVLTDTQDQLFNKIGDFFQSKQKIEVKNKFMNGIENVDYKKLQQLKFIEKEYITSLQNKISQTAQGKKVRDYLTWYKQISWIEPHVFKREGFDNYIEKLMQR